MDFKITNFTLDRLKEVQEFANKYIGQNYFSKTDLLEVYTKSLLNDLNCSYLLLSEDKVKGIRLSYMPGKWTLMRDGIKGLSSHLWNELTIKDLGYFQSAVIVPELSGKGFGQVLANLSIDTIKKAGGKGILTHSWMQSPHNSSKKYLEKLGFKLINCHRDYWKNIDFTCPICVKACSCTAGEMLLVFNNKKEEKILS